MSLVTFVCDICHVVFAWECKYLSTMPAFQIFLLLSMIANLATLGFHHAHGLLFGDITYGVTLCLLGYGSLLALVQRPRITALTMASAVLTLALQHGFMDLRFQGLPVNSQESIWVLFIFLFVPLLFLAWYAKRSVVIAYILLSAVADIGLGFWLQPHFELFFATALKAVLWRTGAFLLSGIALAHLFDRLRKANQVIQNQALANAQLAESRERNRIARELHDTLAHSLSALAVQLEAIDATWDENHAQNRARIGMALQTTRQGLTETRRALQNLQAHPLESLGLCGAVRQCAELACQRASCGLVDQIEEVALNLPAPVSHGFFRIAQEALENVVRHAQAQTVTVRLCQDGSELILQVIDNGVGFRNDDSHADHFGLQGMRERANLLNAFFQLQTHESQGTTIELRWSYPT